MEVSKMMPSNPVHDLIEVIEIRPDVFRSKGRLHIPVMGRSVFGGQVVAQSLLACSRTVTDLFMPHSLHAYFVAPASDRDIPLELRVERVRDGRSYTVRSVRVYQGASLVYIALVSFSVSVAAVARHHAAMPEDEPLPETLLSTRELWAAAAEERSLPESIREVARAASADEVLNAVEWRPVRPYRSPKPTFLPPQQAQWFRAAAPGVPSDLVRSGRDGSCDWQRPQQRSFALGTGAESTHPAATAPLSTESARLHYAVLAYGSDYGLIATALLPWGVPNHHTAMMASLDHSMWFHAPACSNDFVLFTQEAATMDNDRALASGRIFARNGTLLASVAQEGVIRWQPGADRHLVPPLLRAFRVPALVPVDRPCEAAAPLPAPPTPRL